MSRPVRVFILYNDQICETEIGLIFVSAQSEDLVFNHGLTLKDLQIMIRYVIYEVRRDNDLDQVIESHCCSRNTILEFYADFIQWDEGGQSSMV
ncbi:hypothetical protein J1N35_043538 [Gossypium stocksii]|uniref:Uncharacterized protein n=1 Tax=Gossypium stocksii TaxID=47602 RepID=A0A9D3U7G2_9ROSI|nr:hypothetical protein J1N35_043538 [Gossypium stocksii]